MRRTGDQDAAGFADTLEPRRDIDALAENVVALNQDIAEMDADAVDDAPGSGMTALRSTISFWIAIAHSTASTTEGNSSSNPSPMVLTMRPPRPATIGSAASRCSPHRPRRPGLVLAHEARIADDVDRHDRGQSAGFGHSNPQERIA